MNSAHRLPCYLAACVLLRLTGTVGCSSSPLIGSGGEGGAGSDPFDGVAGAVDAAGAGGEAGDSSTTVVNVFNQMPQFGIYVEADPENYSPPNGVAVWSHGTEFVSKLSDLQQSQLGSDLAVRVSYWAQCDEYDRLGGIFMLLEPKGRSPQPSDPRIELVRFITPFSDFRQGALAKHVYPDADVSAYSQAMADPTHDVWIGIAGGSNPHPGDACSTSDGTPRPGVTADFASIGFKYSVDLVSTQPLERGTSLVLPGISKSDQPLVPVEGTFSNDGDAISGHVTVVVSGHGSADGGDEYLYTHDTVTLNGVEIGSFSTKVNCAPYAQFSPLGNPGIFSNNQIGNPRNWCPGALVPSHTFDGTLAAGDNTVGLAIEPSTVPEGSYYSISITFSAP